MKEETRTEPSHSNHWLSLIMFPAESVLPSISLVFLGTDGNQCRLVENDFWESIHSETRLMHNALVLRDAFFTKSELGLQWNVAYICCITILRAESLQWT